MGIDGMFHQDNLTRIEYAARRLKVPARWLRAEAEAGRIPHLRAGKVIMVSIDTVLALLTDRAAREGMHVPSSDTKEL